nr:MucR family transcriptional regulator [Pseudogemmobacter faecipullorum]
MDLTMQEKNTLVAQIVASYAARPDATVDSIVALTSRLTAELGDSPAQATALAAAPLLPPSPNLTPETAITRDRIFCLCCGKGFKMLKRHLGAEHGMTEEAYRAAYQLAESYPLVAPSYSERKASYARSVGFGKYDRNTAEVE